MSSQSRYANEIINSSDAIKACIQVLPEVASLWILYSYAEPFESQFALFKDVPSISFRDWLIQLTPEKVEVLEDNLFGLSMGAIDMREDQE